MYAAPRPVRHKAPAPRRAPLWHRAIAFVLKTVLPLVLLAGAGLLAQRIMDKPPVAERAGAGRQARLVEVAAVAPAAGGPVIEAWGAVEPARRLILRPEISGAVTELHPLLTAGGEIGPGDVLVRLDDREAQLAIAQAQAEIDRLDAQILIERGQGDRAARDLERSEIRLSITPEQRALVLREPQMAELVAQRASAEAARDAAVLRAQKAVVRASFAALVESEQVAPGAVVSAGSEIARLVATDQYHVRLAISPAVLVRLGTDPGQPVVLSQPGVWPDGAERMGRIARIGAALTETGRMAELVVEIPDPLAREPAHAGLPRVLIGSFLAARIEGEPLAGAVTIERAWLRDGDTVWVMNPDDRLEIRPVQIGWRGASEVLLTGGLAPGERVVTTDLATYADGMALRLGEGDRS